MPTAGVMMLGGAALWGLHMGADAGAAVGARRAPSAPDDLRGTAFGVFNLVCGIALLIASALAGWLWDAFGPRVTFYAARRSRCIAWVGFLLVTAQRGGVAGGLSAGLGRLSTSTAPRPSTAICSRSSRMRSCQ